MTAPSGNVQLPAADWANYQAEIQAVTSQITSAITTLTPLLQAATVPPADEADFTAAVSALQAAGTSLAALGQSTPTPAPST
jgi:hypothetical protein